MAVPRRRAAFRRRCGVRRRVWSRLAPGRWWVGCGPGLGATATRPGRRARPCAEEAGRVVQLVQPAGETVEVRVRPESQIGAARGAAAEPFGGAEPVPGVDPAHVHPLAAGLGFPGEAFGYGSGLPFGAASDEQDVEVVPRHAE